MPEAESGLKIVADAGILAVEDGFASRGELVLRPGRELTPDDVRDADALIVRSITRVDAGLLDGSRVRFVATATSGTDHLDLEWLRAHDITVADAAGANANAVAAYVLAALDEIRVPADPLAVIVGAGHVGCRVLRRLRERGLRCVVVDPFVERDGVAAGVRRDFDDRLPAMEFAALDEVIDQAGLVTCHVPLTRSGPHPTAGLLDAARLERLAPGSVLINTARGGLIDEAALVRRLARRGDLETVLDVFENEPEVDRELVQRSTIATPHIAGYSRAAKQAATERVLAAFREHFGLSAGAESRPATGTAWHDEPAPSPMTLTRQFRDAIQAVPPGESLAPVFDALRRERLRDH